MGPVELGNLRNAQADSGGGLAVRSRERLEKNGAHVGALVTIDQRGLEVGGGLGPVGGDEGAKGAAGHLLDFGRSAVGRCQRLCKRSGVSALGSELREEVLGGRSGALIC